MRIGLILPVILLNFMLKRGGLLWSNYIFANIVVDFVISWNSLVVIKILGHLISDKGSGEVGEKYGFITYFT